jgi:hypothetical protein
MRRDDMIEVIEIVNRDSQERFSCVRNVYRYMSLLFARYPLHLLFSIFTFSCYNYQLSLSSISSHYQSTLSVLVSRKSIVSRRMTLSSGPVERYSPRRALSVEIRARATSRLEVPVAGEGAEDIPE